MFLQQEDWSTAGRAGFISLCVCVCVYVQNATLKMAMGRPGQSQAVDAQLERWPENCELRTITLADPSREAPARHYADFAGGNAYKN